MSTCCICESTAKYKCPKCGRSTCLLACVNAHKQQFTCSGKVDPTEFVSRDAIAKDAVHLQRDYRYLTQFKRELEVTKDDLRQRTRKVFKKAHSQSGGQLWQQAKRMQQDPRVVDVQRVFPHAQVSTKRQNTLVVNVAPGMARSQSNKSGYDKKLGQFVWTIEWVVLGGDGAEIKRFTSFRIREATLLSQAVPIHVVRQNAPDFCTEKPVQFYLENVINKKLIKLSDDTPLLEALQDRVVLEYPTIYLASPETTLPKALDTGDDSSSEESSDDSSDDSDSSDSESDDEPPEETPIVKQDEHTSTEVIADMVAQASAIDSKPELSSNPSESVAIEVPPVKSVNELDLDMDFDEVPTAPDEAPQTPRIHEAQRPSTPPSA